MKQKSLWERLGPTNSILGLVISILTLALILNTLFSRTPQFGKIKYIEEERKQLEERLKQLEEYSVKIELINQQLKDRQTYIEKIKAELVEKELLSSTLLEELRVLEKKIRETEKEIEKPVDLKE